MLTMSDRPILLLTRFGAVSNTSRIFHFSVLCSVPMSDIFDILTYIIIKVSYGTKAVIFEIVYFLSLQLLFDRDGYLMVMIGDNGPQGDPKNHGQDR